MNRLMVSSPFGLVTAVSRAPMGAVLRSMIEESLGVRIHFTKARTFRPVKVEAPHG
jgi:hypothetical protein